MHKKLLLLIFTAFAVQLRAQVPQVRTIVGTFRNQNDTALQSQFRSPYAIVFNAQLNEYYVSDEGNFNIRRIKNGRVSLLAGSDSLQPGTRDSVGVLARFTGPRGLAINTTGDTLYVADRADNRDGRIRAVLLTGSTIGQTFTLAGASPGGPTPTNNSVGRNARFQGLRDLIYRPGYLIAVEDAGIISRIRKIALNDSNAVTSLDTGGFAASHASSITYTGVTGLALVQNPSQDSVYVTTSTNYIIKISLSSGGVDTVAGSGSANLVNGPARTAGFRIIRGIALSRTGDSVFVAEAGNNAIRVIDLNTRLVSTLVGGGNGTSGGYVDSTGTLARFNMPNHILVETGRLLVTDLGNGLIRTVTLDSAQTGTFAGLRPNGFSNTTFSEFKTGGIRYYRNGSYLIADRTNHVIRMLNADGSVVAFAGTGISAYRDSTLSESNFKEPNDIEVIGDMVYIADAGNSRVRALNMITRRVSTVCSTGVSKLVYQSDTSLFLISSEENLVKHLNLRTGVVRVFSGSGGAGSIDGPATVAQLRRPGDGSVFRDTLYVATGSGSGGPFAVRAIATSGDSAGSVRTRYQTSSGRNDYGLSLNNPGDLVIDRFGMMYISNNGFNGGIPRINLVINERPEFAKLIASAGAPTNGLAITATAGKVLILALDSLQTTLTFIDADYGLIRSIAPLYATINRAPTYTRRPGNLPGGGNPNILEDSPRVVVRNFIRTASANASPLEPVPGQQLTFQLSNNRPGMFSIQPIIMGDSLVFGLAPDSNGRVTVRLRAIDNGGTASGGTDSTVTELFTINITAVNDAPRMHITGNILESPTPATPRSISRFIDSMSQGPINEGQSLSVSATNDNIALFTALPTLTYDRVTKTASLNYTPSGIVGTANVRVRLRDNGGVLNGGVDTTIRVFTITFNPVLSAKPISAKAQVKVYPNPASQIVNVSITNTTEGSLRARLLNLLGVEVAVQELAMQRGEGKMQFNLQGLARGIYFVKVEGRSASTTHKIQVR